MITREQIRVGIEQGVVRFIVDPNMEHGTVCEIGEHWFYFGGETAEAENPVELLKNADISEVVNSVVEALKGIEQLDDYEYGYYEAVLKENAHVGRWKSFDTLAERDEKLEALWKKFDDVPMNPETECIEEDFLHFPHGTDREDIWKWFDERHSRGVAYLLYGDGVDRTELLSKLCYLNQLCQECDAEHCVFNPKGICLFPMVGERAPALSDDGCEDFCYKEEL